MAKIERGLLDMIINKKIALSISTEVVGCRNRNFRQVF